MPGRLCSRCGRPVPEGKSCPRCGSARSASRRTKDAERARKSENPWRSEYGSAEYQRNRQIALDKTDGRCAVSGIRIADKRNGRWVMRQNGGVHHIVALSEGGDNSVGNLLPLDVRVHAQIEARRRRGA